jgi:hypothetical protein
LNAPQPEPVVIEAIAAFMQRVAQVDITCVPAARPDISMSRQRLHQIAATQPKPVHTKPGRRHEKTSWLHQETPVIHMALGWAWGKFGPMPG